jgi:hypothetical protein
MRKSDVCALVQQWIDDGIPLNFAELETHLRSKFTNKNIKRELKSCLQEKGKIGIIPTKELRIERALADRLRTLTPPSEKPLLKEWEELLGRNNIHCADNRYLKLALDIAELPWTITLAVQLEERVRPGTPVKADTGSWYCRLYQTEMTASGRESLKSQHVLQYIDTPYIADPEVAKQYYDKMRCSDNPIATKNELNGHRGQHMTSAHRSSGKPALRDGRLCLRGPNDAEIWFDSIVEYQQVKDAYLTSDDPNKMFTFYKNKQREIVCPIVHGEISRCEHIFLLNMCPKEGDCATKAVFDGLQSVAAECQITLHFRDLRDVCRCDQLRKNGLQRFCLPIPSEGDDLAAIDKKFFDIIADAKNRNAGMIIQNRGIGRRLQNKVLVELATLPFWVFGFQPSRYNTLRIGESMACLFTSIGLTVSFEQLHAWASVPSEHQLQVRFTRGADICHPRNGRWVVLFQDLRSEKFFDNEEDARICADQLLALVDDQDTNERQQILFQEDTVRCISTRGQLRPFPHIFIVNACPKIGEGPTSAFCKGVVEQAGEVKIFSRNIRSVCCCADSREDGVQKYCLRFSNTYDNFKELRENLSGIIDEAIEANAAFVVTNRFVCEIITVALQEKMMKLPFYAIAWQPHRYNQTGVNEQMTALLQGLGLQVTAADLAGWASTPSDAQACVRYKRQRLAE